MSGRPTVTAAIITLNEERNLRELLPSLDFVDEIVLVDGRSRDASQQVARSHGCRVVSRRFDTFAAQRNRAIRAAQGDWVLSLDADERPTPGLAEEIGSRIVGSRADAYRVPIRSRIFGRAVRRCGTQDDCPIRLFRRLSARWSGDVHEVLQVAGCVDRLGNWLTHDPLPDLETFLTKMHRYTLLEARSRVALRRRPSWRDTWISPPREVFRRLIYKRGFLDGPAGWAFCLLSGLSQWVLAREHRRLQKEAVNRA